MKKDALFRAAVAGITLGLAASPRAGTEETKGAEETRTEVRCYGINSCGSHAKCGIKQDDLDAVKTLLGEKEYTRQFGKSEVHTCGSHAKCGASFGILNWVPTTPGECSAKGGLLIEKADGKKVARKA